MSVKNFLAKLRLRNQVLTPEQALQVDIAEVKRKYGIVVEPTGLNYRGGDTLYHISDAVQEIPLGTIGLRDTSSTQHEQFQYHAGELIAKIADLAKVEKPTLYALVMAHEFLHLDAKQVREQTGIAFYVPTALEIQKRTMQGANGIEQQVYVNTEAGVRFSSGVSGYSSSVALGAGVLWVGVTEPVPGVHSYPASVMYKEGQFMEKFLADTEMTQAYLERVRQNAMNITPSRGLDYINWGLLAADLAHDSSRTLASLKNLPALNGKYSMVK